MPLPVPQPDLCLPPRLFRWRPTIPAKAMFLCPDRLADALSEKRPHVQQPQREDVLGTDLHVVAVPRPPVLSETRLVNLASVGVGVLIPMRLRRRVVMVAFREILEEVLQRVRGLTPARG